MASLSLLITYYNEISYIDSCLNSISSQTQLPNEILIYDDASSYSPIDIISKYSNLNIKYFKGEENKGPGYARNYLLQKATSEYVHFHDTDDLLKPNAIELINSRLNNGVDLVFNEVESRRGDQIVSAYVLNYAELNQYNGLMEFAILKSILIPSITYRKEHALKLGGFKLRDILAQSEDFEFHIRLVNSSKTWDVILESIVIQQLRDDSHSHISVNKKDVWLSAIRALEINRDIIDDKYTQVIAERIYLCAVQLYRLNEFAHAKKAFDKARKIAQPFYSGRSKAYILIAKNLNEMIAERISRWIN